MTTSRSKLARTAVKLMAISVISLWATKAHAAMMSVDPGSVGGLSNSPILAGHAVSLIDPILDIVFTDMKHVEATRWGFELTAGQIFFYRFFLTDEFGQEIPGTGRSDINLPAGPFSAFGNSTIPIVAHDIHFQFESAPDSVIDVFVDGRVGEWGPEVPEPSTLVLWSLGAVGLVGFGWRRRKRAA